VSLCLNQEKISANGVGKINLTQRENRFYFYDPIGRYLFLF